MNADGENDPRTNQLPKHRSSLRGKKKVPRASFDRGTFLLDQSFGFFLPLKGGKTRISVTLPSSLVMIWENTPKPLISLKRSFFKPPSSLSPASIFLSSLLNLAL